MSRLRRHIGTAELVFRLIRVLPLGGTVGAYHAAMGYRNSHWEEQREQVQIQAEEKRGRESFATNQRM